jgi:hypothetical protein
MKENLTQDNVQHRGGWLATTIEYKVGPNIRQWSSITDKSGVSVLTDGWNCLETKSNGITPLTL